MVSRLLSNVLSDFGGRVVHVISTGVLLIFLTRTLGPELYGLLALAISIFATARFFSESGLPRSAARYIAQFKEDDPGTAFRTVLESWKLLAVAAAVVSLALAALSEPVATHLDEPALAPLLVVGSGYVFFYSIHTHHRFVMQGFEAIAASAKVHSLEGACTLVFVVGLVLYDPTPLSAVTGYVLGYAVAAVAGFVVVYRLTRGIDASDSSRGTVRAKILTYNVPMSVTRLSDEVDQELDTVLVGFFTNPTQVAFYTLGKQISQFTRVPAASIGFALSPTYGSEQASGQLEQATEVYQESLSKTLILYVPAVAGILAIADVAIPTIFGEGYADGVLVVRVLALFVLFEALEQISGPALDYLGRARSRAVLKSVTSFGNLGLNLVLIPLYGAAGAAAATVVTFGLYAVCSVAIVYTELPFDPRRVGISLSKVAGISLVMGASVYGLTDALTGYASLVLGVGVGVAIWLLACHLFGLLDFRRLLVQLRG
ncbi:oligosaccharide flippase family protein [Natrinema sp. LN54]|uniref:oligosaccharide flippase family protein n=1 Tax=Natrinema sp. LN54 TaxID=3458705 RepID=UPI0040369C64